MEEVDVAEAGPLQKRLLAGKATDHDPFSLGSPALPGQRRGSLENWSQSAPRARGSAEMLLDLPLEMRLRDGADHRVHVLAVTEKQNARDRPDVEPDRRALVAVHVELGHLDLAGVLPGQLVDHR